MPISYLNQIRVESPFMSADSTGAEFLNITGVFASFWLSLLFSRKPQERDWIQDHCRLLAHKIKKKYFSGMGLHARVRNSS